MRILFTNFGTRGDFEPLFALARELRGHGHQPVFAIPASATALVRPTGFEYSVIISDVVELRDRINLAWATNRDAYSENRSFVGHLLSLGKHLPEGFEALRKLSYDASLLVSGPTQPLARIVHETTGIPFVSVQVGHFGGHGGPAIRDAGDRLVNPFRSSLGLPRLADPLTTGANSPQLALYAMSRHLTGRPIEWPMHYKVTGFFFSPPATAGPADLLAFLEAGTPPVAVTFGSMPHDSIKTLEETVCRAIQRCNRRAVLQGFGLRNGPLESMPGMFAVGEAAHSWLFSRCACVVTHGGAGTTAAILRAGLPGVFVPHSDLYDQHYWAQLVFEGGYAVAPLPLRELDEMKLSHAIEESIESCPLRARVSELAARVRNEQGVETASRLIEALARSLGIG